MHKAVGVPQLRESLYPPLGGIVYFEDKPNSPEGSLGAMSRGCSETCGIRTAWQVGKLPSRTGHFECLLKQILEVHRNEASADDDKVSWTTHERVKNKG